MKITLGLSAPLCSLLPRIGEGAFISDELERIIVNEILFSSFSLEIELASPLVCQPRLEQDLILFTTDVQNNICYFLNC